MLCFALNNHIDYGLKDGITGVQIPGEAENVFPRLHRVWSQSNLQFKGKYGLCCYKFKEGHSVKLTAHLVKD